MNMGDIDMLETEAEKAITKLAELAIEHSNDAIEWRRRYNELVNNLSKLCLYDRDKECKPNSYFNIPFMTNYGDGVDGHYCIAKNRGDGVREYYDADQKKWGATGTLYKLADSV